MPTATGEARAAFKSRLRDKSTHPSGGEQMNNIRRRTRSHSRNYRAILNSPAGGGESSADAGKRGSMPGQASVLGKRLIPFDLFLINLRYNRAYAAATSGGIKPEDKAKSSFEISKLIEEFLTSVESSDIIDRQEKLLLNSQNIQVFLEQLCPHKRHIKLDNLKSINLSNNKIKRFEWFSLLLSYFIIILVSLWILVNKSSRFKGWMTFKTDRIGFIDNNNDKKHK